MKILPLTVGPIVGVTTSTTTRLWGRGNGAFGPDGRPQRCFGIARFRKSGSQRYGPATMFKMKAHFDFTGIIDLEDLSPNTAYDYQIGFFNAELDADNINNPPNDDETWEDAHNGRFTTAPSSARAATSFIFGSCRYLLRMFGGTFFDERGDKAFRSIMEQVRNGQETDFVLMVGDQIYADDLNVIGPDTGLDDFNKRYRISFCQEHIRDMMSHVPTYMILDDHEIEDNWSQDKARSNYNLYAAAMQSYHSYQLVHGPAFVRSGRPNHTDTPENVWYSYRTGASKLFVMDTRTERFEEPEAIRRMIGPEQMAALKAWLDEEEDTPTARFIVSSVPFFPEFMPDPDDKWTRYKEQRFEILEHIRMNNIRRVVFLGGDVHCSLTAQLAHEDDDAFTVTSVISSSFFWPYPQGRKSDFAMGGSLDEFAHKYRITRAGKVFSTDNFTRVSYDPRKAANKLVVAIHDRKGGPLQRTTLNI